MPNNATTPTLTAAEFAAKWLGSSLKESAASQSHFNDLCRVLGGPTPTEADPAGDWYTFEKGVEKTGGGNGFADVWKRGHFAWEYKGKHKDLTAAYDQLLQYREALENPPLLVVCDLERFEVHTNFTGTPKQVYAFDLHQLRDDPAEPLRILRSVMREPEALRPKRTREQVTEEAARQFAELAGRLQNRGHEPHQVAHFLNKLLFCFFAEDTRLLPRDLLSKLIAGTRNKPADFTERLAELFRTMSDKDGWFGAERIQWFNGGLFDGSAVLPLEADDLEVIAAASRLDWAEIEPSILGTLFERGLDPDKRGQLGAHYTDKGSIMRVVEPVVLVPLRREYAAMQSAVETRLAGRTPSPLTRDGLPRKKRPRWERDAEAEFFQFLDRLRDLRILDPACGSGNFLYVALQCVKDLEKETTQWGWENLHLMRPFPAVDPSIVHGIEINDYAAELARVTVWIGEIQWMLNNGFHYRDDPILRPLDNIERRDAIIDLSDPEHPRPADWPEAEFIIGNPPFLGSQLVLTHLDDQYVEDLRDAWRDRVPASADLVCYWHEKAREEIEHGRAKRAGLLATNSIRGGANRRVLERIKQTGDIFMAWSDEEWVVEDAAVRVSIVAQDDGSETTRTLDGEPVGVIYSDLTSGIDLTIARRLRENVSVAFQGPVKVGPFDIPRETARQLVQQPNPNGRSSIEVVRPLVNGTDIVRRSRDMWIIEFPDHLSEAEAAQFEAPFEYVREHVRPIRAKNKDSQRRTYWWRLGRSGADLRTAVNGLFRFLMTPRVSKHRVFVWVHPRTLADSATIAIARDVDYTFGVLHSRAHELWALRTGTWLGKGNDPRYTPTTTLETFPFPWPLDTPDDALTPEQRAHRDTIAAAAYDLNEIRERWLNPPDLVREEPDVVPSLPPRLIPVDEEAANILKQRTLTKLYNDRPQWLDNLHRDLDAAVFAAYGWPADISDEDILRNLLDLNLQRAAVQQPRK